MLTSRYHATPAESRRTLRFFGGKFRRSPQLMLISIKTENIMTFLSPYADPIIERHSTLEGLIATAKAEVAAAETEVAAAHAAIEAVEPHPHAHGYTAAGDCTYASISPDDYLSLAGLLTRPWRETLALVDTIRDQNGFDYLLKAFPGAFAEIGDTLIVEGSMMLEDPDNRADQYLPELYRRKPTLALGMVWRLFGYHRRDHPAWIGAFASRIGVLALIASNADIPEDMCVGDAIAATVTAHHAFLTPIGERELHRRAARRDAGRQASWAQVPDEYRNKGVWRVKAPTKKQRNLMRRIEIARGLSMTAMGRRGENSDWITTAGGNPRFNTPGKERS